MFIYQNLIMYEKEEIFVKYYNMYEFYRYNNELKSQI